MLVPIARQHRRGSLHRGLLADRLTALYNEAHGLGRGLLQRTSGQERQRVCTGFHSSPQSSACSPAFKAAPSVPDRKLLVGKWEGNARGIPMGYEFMEGGKAFYHTLMVDGEPSLDGKPVKLACTFGVGQANWLVIHQPKPDGSSSSGYSFTVSKDEITFYKADGVAGGGKRVQTFSKTLTGAK